MYRCPLCLNRVGDSDKFVRYCPQHPGSTVEFSGEDLRTRDLSAAICPVADCSSSVVVNTTGLLIKHVGCPVGHSPFVRGPVDKSWKGQNLRHWELIVLEEIAKSVKAGPAKQPWVSLISGPEMVFPFGLLVRHDSYPSTPPSHVLVGVLGAKNAGKTFLSLHLADPDGYGRSLLPPPRDYLYAVPGDGTGAHEDFLNTLLIRQLLETNQDFRPYLDSTRERALNLKAGLFPRETLQQWLENHGKKPAANSAQRRKPGLFGSAFGEIGAALKRIVTVPGSADDVGSDYCSLLLYDIAGEAVMAGDSKTVDEHLNAMDVNIVLVSAEDILSDNQTGALDVANNLLTRLAAWKTLRPGRKPARVAVVITKLDLGPNGLRAASSTQINADSRRGTLHGELLQLRSPGARALARLACEESPTPLVDRVFFIKPTISKGFVFEIHGLSDLVRWCFDPKAI
jgi:hypothetical protein